MAFSCISEEGVVALMTLIQKIGPTANRNWRRWIVSWLRRILVVEGKVKLISNNRFLKSGYERWNDLRFCNGKRGLKMIVVGCLSSVHRCIAYFWTAAPARRELGRLMPRISLHDKVYTAAATHSPWIDLHFHTKIGWLVLIPHTEDSSPMFGMPFFSLALQPSRFFSAPGFHPPNLLMEVLNESQLR